MSKTLSIVIPCYAHNDATVAVTYSAIMNYRDLCDELIVVLDGGKYEYVPGFRVFDHSNYILVFSSDNRGFTKAVNIGWNVASCDYIAIVNSDTFIEDGNIKDLCIPKTITHPRVITSSNRSQFGAFFVVPKTIKSRLDERFRMYYSDDDFYRRHEDRIQYVPQVTVRHAYGYTTMNTDPDYYTELAFMDKIRFEEKWKK